MSILREELITNHLLLDYFDLWDEFDIKSASNTDEIRYYNHLMNLINGQLDAGVRWLDTNDAQRYFTGETEYQREVFRALEDEWDNILEGKYNSVDALLSEVYRKGKAKGYNDMRSRIRYTEQDKQALKIARNYNYHLIRKIDNNVRSQIKNQIIRGVIAGDHPNTIAPKILSIAEEKLDGSNFTPKQRATMIARTEISRVQNTGILQSYINEGYIEVKILTAEDSNVCDLCLRYAFEFNEDDEITFENRGDERVHNIIKLIKNGKFPPFHPLCRCTYLSVWKSKSDPPKNPHIINLLPNNINEIYTLLFNKDSTKLIEVDGNKAYGVNESPDDKFIFEMKYGISEYDFSVNSSELKLIKLYSGPGFTFLNEYFRRTVGVIDPNELEQIKAECELGWNSEFVGDENYLTFDEAINASKTIYNYAKELEEDLVVVRRQKTSMFEYSDGDTYYNSGFLSTSISKEIYDYGDYVNYIRIPKGSKILYIEGVTLEENEFEVLLPPNIELHLVDEVSDKLLKWTL